MTINKVVVARFALFFIISIWAISTILLISKVRSDNSKFLASIEPIQNETQLVEIVNEQNKNNNQLSKVTDVTEKVTEPTKVSRGNAVNRHLSVPQNVNTNFKTYSHYKMITDKTSDAWKLQQKAHTDSKGFRRIGNDYCVALGSYYSTNIGDRFKITLDGGNSFTVILSDLKQDRHTDSTHRYIPHNGNVIEFLIDIHKLDKLAKKMGTVSVIDGLDGKIVKIEKIEE